MPITKNCQTILGIDPGFAITGYGVIKKTGNRTETICSGAITTSTKEEFSDRLFKIYQGIEKIIKKYKPDIMAVEELFFAKNTKTALKVGQARGVAILAGVKNKLIIKEFTPLQVKQAITGYGFASKNQMQLMIKLILKLKKTPKPDDVADALSIAVCCGQTKEFI
ncbi:MAG: crossover junction endodeoxyribonuclease RuvC [Patescibacteria group bacterium]|jgi:crossover junction endodeoxyribonuclease RuvC